MDERGRGRDRRGRSDDAGEEQGMEARGRAEEDSGGVLTLVCFKCGTEYYFADGDPPASMSCEKCENTVFRSFFTAGEDDEAAADFRESTERDLRPDDAEGEALPGDVIDLNRD